MLNIGNLQVNSNFLLAPMSGVTDYPYREIVKKFKTLKKIKLPKEFVTQDKNLINPANWKF